MSSSGEGRSTAMPRSAAWSTALCSSGPGFLRQAPVADAMDSASWRPCSAAASGASAGAACGAHAASSEARASIDQFMGTG